MRINQISPLFENMPRRTFMKGLAAAGASIAMGKGAQAKNLNIQSLLKIRDPFNEIPWEEKYGAKDAYALIYKNIAYLGGYVDGKLGYLIDDPLGREGSVPIEFVIINSRGGQISRGLHIAESVRKLKITTIVPNGAQCMSAATVIFQAGVRRYASRNSTFMYHGIQMHPSLSDPNTKEEVTKATEQMFQILQNYGASQKLFEDFKRQPPDKQAEKNGNWYGLANWYLPAEKCVQYDVVQKVF